MPVGQCRHTARRQEGAQRREAARGARLRRPGAGRRPGKRGPLGAIVFPGRGACAFPDARGRARRRSGRLARSAAVLVGPPGERPGRARLPAHGVRPRRLPALEQLLVRRALQLRHVQRPVLPARRAVRDQGARDHLDRDCSARVRRRRVPAMGADGPLVEQDVRRRVGWARHLSGVPVRPRDRARSARDLGSSDGEALAVRRARGPDRRRKPACISPARHLPRRRRSGHARAWPSSARPNS